VTSALVRSRAVIAALAVVATLAGLAGCSLGGDSTLPPYTNPATQVYDTSTHVNIATMTRVDSQLYVTDVTVGTGRTVAYGDSITVFYSGKLPGGSVFSSLLRPSAPFTAALDTVNLIKGWSSGLPGMKVGGTRRLVIGPGRGYGYSIRTDANGFVIIPSNSVLVFDVEVTNATPKP
jgi:FKBP-type peptidyl-prolyl cis-trans isomerase